MSTLTPTTETNQSAINKIIRMEWTHELTRKETDLIYTLAVSNERHIRDLIHDLCDRAYEMQVEEAKEMTRASILGIFDRKK